MTKHFIYELTKHKHEIMWFVLKTGKWVVREQCKHRPFFSRVLSVLSFHSPLDVVVFLPTNLKKWFGLRGSISGKISFENLKIYCQMLRVCETPNAESSNCVIFIHNFLWSLRQIFSRKNGLNIISRQNIQRKSFGRHLAEN